MIVYDRIFSKVVEISEPKELIHSRYLYKTNDYLIANPDGTIEDENSVIPVLQLIDENTEDILSLISDDLSSCKSTRTFAEISPLYRNTKSLIKLRNKDKEIVKRVIYIESIFNKPEIDITKTEERVHLSKVKRINYKSVRFLAMHSEDWESRRNNDVYPKRLLAENQFVDYEIYENTVAKTLLDSLLKYWIRLRNQKQVVKRSNFKMERFQSYDTELNYNLARRIFGLWSPELYNSLAIENRLLDQTIEEITSILRRLSKLKGSPLDKNVFKKTSPNSILKWTNKFRHHADYRNIPVVWDILNRTSTTKDEYKQQITKVINNFHSYMLLILMRVLKELNWICISDGQSMEENCQITFINSLLDLELSFNISSDQNFEISFMGKKLIFIPLAADFNGISEESIRNIIVSSSREINTNEFRVVVFCSMKEGDLTCNNKYLRTYNLLYNKSSIEKKIVFSSVSPLDIFSNERIRSVFLEWFYFNLMERYPVSINCPPILRENIEFRTLGFQIFDKSTIIINKPIQNELGILKKEAEKVQRKLDSTSDKFSRELFRNNLASLLSTIENSNYDTILKPLFSCPTCGKDNSGNIEHRLNNEFEARCADSNCSTTFGVKYCGECSRHFFYKKGPHFEQLIDKYLSASDKEIVLEEDFASDIIAMFKVTDIDKKEIKWICPFCESPS